MHKFLIWGTGYWAEYLMPITRRITSDINAKIIGFVDNNRAKTGNSYMGLPVYSAEKVHSLSFDMIYIYAYADNFETIHRQIVEDLHIPSHKVGSASDLVFLAQKHRRESMTVRQTRKSMIYDCFPFFNEVEILHIRMDLLADVVDRFVIVEMNRDHRGREKPYNFLKVQDEFAQYKDRIIYVQPQNIPAFKGIGDWTLENFQRNCITMGLSDAEPEDIICVSDCDELINPDILKRLKEQEHGYSQEPMTKILDIGALALEQEYYCYFFNCRLRKKQNTSLIIKYKNLIEPHAIRTVKDLLPFIKNGGWHLTYFGGLEKVRLKTDSIVEGTPVTDEDILRRMEQGLDPYGREGEYFDADFLDKDDISIPNVDKLIEKYPQFYHEVGK